MQTHSAGQTSGTRLLRGAIDNGIATAKTVGTFSIAETLVGIPSSFFLLWFGAGEVAATQVMLPGFSIAVDELLA